MSPRVPLDKYREKQRHGGSNENENKGALGNYGSSASCAARRRRGNRDTFPTLRTNPPNGEKTGRMKRVTLDEKLMWKVLFMRIPLITLSIHARFLNRYINNAYIFVYSRKCILSNSYVFAFVTYIFILNFVLH